MPDPNPEALSFLLSRRSCSARTLTAPYPDRETLETILTAAARSPDHGKLEPWRFIVLQGEAPAKLVPLMRERGTALGADPDKLDNACTLYARAGTVLVVVASPVPSEKVPAGEQALSAGAVCLAALNAALASGWGANWLTGWMATDRPFLEQTLGLAAHEYVAGFIHIGTAPCAPPERPRPDLAKITEWRDA